MGKIKVILLLVITIISFSFSGNDPLCEPEAKKEQVYTKCGIINNSFAAREVLKYDVGYKMGWIWISAGVVDFKIEEGNMFNKACYHITGFGKTHKSYDWFFKVRDKYETYIDKQTMLPLKFIRDVNEGGYKIYNDVTFDRENNKVTSVKGTFDVPECTHDVLSAIYYSRCINFNSYTKNDTIPLTLFLDNKVYKSYIRYLGKETVKTDFGKVRCVKFKPLLIEGTIFEGGESMVVWATDDENRIPVLIESPILVGSIKAELKSYSNLRNNFTALVE